MFDAAVRAPAVAARRSNPVLRRTEKHEEPALKRHRSDRLGLSVALLLSGSAPGIAVGNDVTLGDLRGKWEGQDLALIINTGTSQANVDGTRPFDWSSFHILNVAHNIVTFEIGTLRYVGLLDPDHQTMTVTIVGRLGQHTLRHTRSTP